MTRSALQGIHDVPNFEVLYGSQRASFGRIAAAALDIIFNQPGFTSRQSVELACVRYGAARGTSTT